jgi:PAS domain S-box-containing protein
MKFILEHLGTIATVVGILATVIGIPGVIFAAIKYYFLFKTSVEDMSKNYAEMKQQSADNMELFKKATEITNYELKTNGGKSIKDVLLKVYGLVQELVDKEDIAFYLDSQPKLEYDSNGYCLKANYKWRELTGLSENDAEGRGWYKAIHEGDRDRVADKWEDTVNRGFEFEDTYRIINRNNAEIHWVKGVAIPKMDNNDLKFICATFEIQEKPKTHVKLHKTA